MSEELKELENELLDKGWIKAWVLFDVQSNDADYAKKALQKHVEKMKKEIGIKVIKENFADVAEVEPPENLKASGVEKMYSQLYEAIMFFKDFETIVNFTVTYAPTAMEILAPEKISVSLKELQNALVTVSDMIHKFAQAGLGGVIISG